MTVISLAQSNIVNRRSSAHKEQASQKNKARKFLAMILIFFILIIGFFYVLQANTIASKDYRIRGLNKQIKVLEDKNKLFQVNISNLKSMSTLQARTEIFNMVKNQNIEYVTLPLTSVVAAK